MRLDRQKGFTLVEMVVVLVLATIVAGFAAMFIATPVQAYFAQTRRAELSDSVEAIVRNIGGDVRTALPNSVRTASNGTVMALEMLETVDVLRYRQAGEVTNAARELDFAAPDNQFSTLGTRNNPGQAFAYFVVNNRGIVGADAYAQANVITPVGTGGITADPVNTGESIVTLNPAFRFTWPGTVTPSPSRSVFLVSGPVTYLCDTGLQTLRRYSGYPISPAISTSAAGLLGAGASTSLIARNVAACQISITPANDTHGDLVTLMFTLADSGESFPLFYQAPVERRP